MSAPETNVKNQEKKHKAPLLGMKWVVGFALALLVILVAVLSFSGNEPANDQPIEEDAAEDAAG
jgi:hypothetical protein